MKKGYPRILLPAMMRPGKGGAANGSDLSMLLIERPDSRSNSCELTDTKPLGLVAALVSFRSKHPSSML